MGSKNWNFFHEEKLKTGVPRSNNRREPDKRFEDLDQEKKVSGKFYFVSKGEILNTAR